MDGKKGFVLSLFSALGCALYFFSIALYMLNGADGLGTVAISALFLPDLISAVFVFVGVICLIIQRIRGLGSRLTRRQLIIGRGFMTYGAMCGAVFSLGSAIVDLIFGYEAGVCFIAQWLMFAGGALCFCPGLPVFKSFKKA